MAMWPPSPAVSASWPPLRRGEGGWAARRGTSPGDYRGMQRRTRRWPTSNRRYEKGSVDGMRITITARHTEIDDDLRAHTQDLIEKATKALRRPQHAQVVFTEDHGEAGVEIEVHAPRGKILVAKSQGADHRSALDGAIARLKRQLSDEKAAGRPRRAPRRSHPTGTRRSRAPICSQRRASRCSSSC